MGRGLGLAAGAAIMFGVGYWAAPREILDEEVKESKIFGTKETKRVLDATVTSLRSENKLVVYSYTGNVRVKVDREWLWGLLGGNQELSIPATVDYQVDLSSLDDRNVRYDEEARKVMIYLPKMQLGSIAFQPERATAINGGLLTFDQDVVDELTKLNYANARKAFTAQAQQPTLVGAAKAQAVRNIVTYFEVPLRAVGVEDVRVEAHISD